MSDTLADIWLDRRVKIGYETAEELAKHYNPLNFRGHPANQRDATEESLDALGYVGQVKKSLHSGVILDGHLRIEIALAKDPSIQLPVDYYDLTPDEELLALQVLDTTTEMAQPIADKLAALMERTKHLTADKPGLAAMLEQLRVRAGVNGNQPTKDVEPQIDKAAQLAEQWGTRVGQVWELGQHRLACGDCTDRAIVEAVMRGEEIKLLLADPPYGKLRIFNDVGAVGNAGSNKAQVKHYGAYKGEGDFSLESLLQVTKYDKAIIWGGNNFTDILPVTQSWLIWDKRAGENNLFYAECELAWSNLGITAKVFNYVWQGMIREGERVDRQHPTQKPIPLYEWCLSLVKDAQVILDPCLGSGAALIACENLSRRCRAIELDPGYCAVSIQRWVDLTGQQPRLISG